MKHLILDNRYMQQQCLARLCAQAKRYSEGVKEEIPEFKSEAEEFEFWSSSGEGADSTAYLDWSHAKHTKFTNLKSSLVIIPLRWPVSTIEKL